MGSAAELTASERRALIEQWRASAQQGDTLAAPGLPVRAPRPAAAHKPMQEVTK